MLECTGVNLHTGNWASAARIASDRLMRFSAAAASSAPRRSAARYNLHGFGTPAAASAPPTFQLVNVTPLVRLAGPLLDLLVAHHTDIGQRK